MANPWKLLQGLLPSEPVQVGSVQALNGDGTSQVAMVGGGVIRVTGDSFAVSQPVFVKGGLIVSAAPSLDIQLIEV